MSSILVVDDSMVDRRMVGGLLEKDADLTVQYAANGEEALAAMRESVPSLVVTDLIMPKVDGLALVTAVRARHPLVPVILMTSKGNEEVAVQALQYGAASYVPKSALAKNLLETVHSVLAAARPAQTQARLLDCMTESGCAFDLDNDCTLIPPLVAYLQDCAVRLGLCDESERIRVGIALEEALANALYHGNLEVSSQLREGDDERYYALVTQRRNQRPYRDRRIRVEARLSRDEGAFVVRDEGPGFDHGSLPDPTDPANLEKISGRGVLLMRTFMDGLEYNESGNEVTMIKRRPPPDDPAILPPPAVAGAARAR